MWSPVPEGAFLLSQRASGTEATPAPSDLTTDSLHSSPSSLGKALLCLNCCFRITLFCFPVNVCWLFGGLVFSGVSEAPVSLPHKCWHHTGLLTFSGLSPPTYFWMLWGCSPISLSLLMGFWLCCLVVLFLWENSVRFKNCVIIIVPESCDLFYNVQSFIIT